MEAFIFPPTLYTIFWDNNVADSSQTHTTWCQGVTGTYFTYLFLSEWEIIGQSLSGTQNNYGHQTVDLRRLGEKKLLICHWCCQQWEGNMDNTKTAATAENYSKVWPTRCNVTQFFISVNCSTCYGLIPQPSSGAQHCIYSIGYLSNRYCYLPLSWKSWNSSTIAAGSSNGLTNTRCCRYSCVCSLWWVEIPPKTYRAVYRYK